MRYLFLLCLIGCARPVSQPNNIDAAFQPLYNQFIVDANQAGLNIKSERGIIIQFAALEAKNSLGEVIGDCITYSNGFNTVNIDTDFWNNASDPAKMILMYHELGHCVLYEKHVPSNSAIMNAVINNPLFVYSSTTWPGMLNVLFADSGNALSP